MFFFTNIACKKGIVALTNLNELIMKEEKATVLGKIIGRIIGLLIGFCVAYFIAGLFPINPSKEYGWFGGGFHGIWAVFNWVRSLFDDTVLLKATLHTSAYNVWWWLGLTWIVCFIVNNVLSTIIEIRRFKKMN